MIAKMKVLYVEAKQKNLEISLPKSEINKLPKKILLAYSIQYKDLAVKVKKQLTENKINVDKFQQVLGCSKINTNLPVLLVSTGKFHAINLFLQSPAIYIIAGNKIEKISESEITKIRNRKKAALVKFLSAEKIGILVSTKPGQEYMNLAVKLKKKLDKKGKEAYIFLTNHINIAEFENFNIDSWVNTACPGLTNDSSDIINITELPKL